MSVVQLLRSLCQLLGRSFCISGGRIERLVTEDLSQPDQIVSRVIEVLVRHCVPQQMRVHLHADDRRVFGKQATHAFLGQRTTLTNKDRTARHRRASLQVRLQCSTSRKRSTLNSEGLPVVSQSGDQLLTIQRLTLAYSDCAETYCLKDEKTSSEVAFIRSMKR